MVNFSSIYRVTSYALTYLLFSICINYMKVFESALTEGNQTNVLTKGKHKKYSILKSAESFEGDI